MCFVSEKKEGAGVVQGGVERSSVAGEEQLVCESLRLEEGWGVEQLPPGLSKREVMEVLAGCIKQEWPVVITG